MNSVDKEELNEALEVISSKIIEKEVAKLVLVGKFMFNSFCV